MANDRTVTKAGYTLAIESGSVTKKVEAEIIKGLREASEIYDAAVVKNVSLTGVSLAEMKEMGHPYAADKPKNVLGDDRQVHIQSGELVDSIKKTKPSQETERRFTVYFSSSVLHAAFLMFGTSKMRPRRFHEKAFEDVKDKIWEPLKANLRGVQHKITARVKK